ncbi:nicotinamidase/pyrazinamidase [Thermoflexales bacterium]|jgi:nicotinamidase-related amidase|nr:nicotinamidase/pyrazinamidase [Thermoflexales bacterium]
MLVPDTAALLIIDVQQAIDHPQWARWGPRNNPAAEDHIAQLLAVWRATQRPIIHVRHMSREPHSPYRPQQPGNEFKPPVAPLPLERIVDKTTNSAFIGTTLEADLRAAGIDTLIITGVITNNSVEATARMAGNLGFNTIVVADATATFARPDFNGVLRSAEEVHALSLANLQDEYAAIRSTREVLAALARA